MCCIITFALNYKQNYLHIEAIYHVLLSCTTATSRSTHKLDIDLILDYANNTAKYSFIAVTLKSLSPTLPVHIILYCSL